MHAADLRRPLGARGFLAAVFEELDARALAATQENQVANGRVCRRAKLVLHEILIDIERSCMKNLDGAEDGLEERNTLFDVGDRDADVMHAKYFIRHLIILVEVRFYREVPDVNAGRVEAGPET